MRDKLIELIKKGGVIIPETAEAVADYLIANNVFVLPEQMKDSWELALPFMARLFVADEAEIESIKREFEIQKVKQILTDIRNYLVEKQQGIKKQGLSPIITATALTIFDAQILALKEYAEKLGVEL